MVIDASAIVAVLAEEPKAGEVIAAIQDHPGAFAVSPMTVFEAALGLAKARTGRKRAAAGEDIEIALAAVQKFLDTVAAEEIAITRDLGREAVAAAARFGRAVGHPADLNFGDCFSYALARRRSAALLFIGDDFVRTDARSVLDDPRPGR